MLALYGIYDIAAAGNVWLKLKDIIGIDPHTKEMLG